MNRPRWWSGPEYPSDDRWAVSYRTAPLANATKRDGTRVLSMVEALKPTVGIYTMVAGPAKVVHTRAKWEMSVERLHAVE